MTLKQVKGQNGVLIFFSYFNSPEQILETTRHVYLVRSKFLQVMPRGSILIQFLCRESFFSYFKLYRQILNSLLLKNYKA